MADISNQVPFAARHSIAAALERLWASVLAIITKCKQPFLTAAWKITSILLQDIAGRGLIGLELYLTVLCDQTTLRKSPASHSAVLLANRAIQGFYDRKELVVKRRWPSLERAPGSGVGNKSVLACPHDGIVMHCRVIRGTK